MPQLPKDMESLSVDRQGMGILHNAFTITGNWEFRQITGRDVGTDCELELIENVVVTGHTFNVQVKSTKTIERMKNKKSEDFSVAIDISTVNYWLNKTSPFLLVLVNVLTSDIYYLLVQNYIAGNPAIQSKLTSNQKSVTLHVPIENIVSKKQEEIKTLVRKSFKGFIEK